MHVRVSRCHDNNADTENIISKDINCNIPALLKFPFICYNALRFKTHRFVLIIAIKNFLYYRERKWREQFLCSLVLLLLTISSKSFKCDQLIN